MPSLKQPSLKRRWLESVSTIGTLYRDTYWLLKKSYGAKGAAMLTNMMYKKGLRASGEYVKRLKLQRNVAGAAKALLSLERTYGIKSRVVKKTPKRIVIRCTSCRWWRKPHWTPEICASIESYERGLVKGIAGARHYATKRKSRGDAYCEIIIEAG